MICLALDRDQWRAVVKGGNEISGSIQRVLAKWGTVPSWSTLHLGSFHTGLFCVWLMTGKVKSCTSRFFEGDACTLRGSHSKIPVVPTYSVWWGYCETVRGIKLWGIPLRIVKKFVNVWKGRWNEAGIWDRVGMDRYCSSAGLLSFTRPPGNHTTSIFISNSLTCISL